MDLMIHRVVKWRRKKKKIKYGERDLYLSLKLPSPLKETGLARHVIRRRLEAGVKELPSKARQAVST